MTKPGSAAALTFLLIVALAGAVVLLDRPPAPLPEDAPEGAFSAARAMAHVRRVAERPHPTGSADNARVREYLAGVLASMGHQVERQRAVAIQASRGVRAARVENLMVRVPGTRSTGAVLFASHYDSVPAGPGASDDAAAVAALIETLRAMRALPPPANDLIFLFTDAEEYGLLGATAFVDQHPWLKDVRVAVNFEARGTSGPSLMFETGPGNGPLVREWARTVPRPAGASLTDAVYKRMPNDTDFSEFKRRGIAGLNFAFIGDWARYHTPRDDVDALDWGSLQHHGEAALGLARRLGEIDLATLQGSDAVYFSVPGAGVVVQYPVGLALPFAGLAVVAFLAAVVRARRQGSVHLGGLVLAVVIQLAVVGLAGFLGFRFARWIAGAHLGWLARGDASMSAAYAVFLIGAVASAWLSLHTLLRKRFAARTLALAGVFLLVGAAVASAWVLPGTSYVPLWPAMAAVAASALLPAAWRETPSGIGRALLLSVLALPALIILWPLAVALYRTLGVVPPSGAAIAVVAALTLAALGAQVEVVTEGRRWWPAGLALLLTLSALAWGAATTRYSADHPRQVNVEYVLASDAGTAQWTARAGEVVPWLRQYLGSSPDPGRARAAIPPWSGPLAAPGFLTADAPIVDLPGAVATLVSRAASPGGRVVTVRLSPAAEGHAVTVWASGATVVDAAVEGRHLPGTAAADGTWSLDFINAPASGFSVTLDCRDGQPLRLAVLNRAAGLPAVPGRTYTPRPADIVPLQMGDLTIVRRDYEF
jgi:hypothetical protein